MMENVEQNINDSDSPYKLKSNYQTAESHHKSLYLMVRKANTSCNVEYENFYELEIQKLKTDLENLQQTEDEDRKSVV